MWRTVLAVAACAVVAAAGAATPAGGVAACSGSQLALSRGAPISAETEEIVRAFNLRNRGPASCVLFGYPGVRLLAHGRPLPFAYRRGGRYYGTRGRPRAIVLGPGRSAWFVVAKFACVGETLAVARELAAIPPNTTQRLHVRFGVYPIFGYCKAFRGPNRKDIGNTVYVGPIHAHA